VSSLRLLALVASVNQRRTCCQEATQLPRLLAAALLFAALSPAPARACSVIRYLEPPACLTLPVPPPGTPTPGLASILAQAKADWSASPDRPECHSRALAIELGQSDKRLLVLLGDRDPVVRVLAVTVLARDASSSEAALARLLRALSDTEGLVAQTALGHALRLTLGREPGAQARLARLDPAQKELLATALLKDIPAHADATFELAQVHPPLVASLVARLASGHENAQYATSAILAALPALAPQYMPALCAATQRSSAHMLAFQASALARGGDACAHEAWIRVLAMDPSRPGTCGGPDPASVLSPRDAWNDASRGLQALGEPGMHALLAAARTDPKPGLIWAISQFGGRDLAAADSALMADVIVKFPDIDKETRRSLGDWPYRQEPWRLNRPLLEALLERSMANIGDQRYALALGKITQAQWRTVDAAGPGGIGQRLLTASREGYPRQRVLALELLGTRYFDLAAPANVLDAARRALDDPNPAVARGGLVALTSFQISGAQVRRILRGSRMIQGTDRSALVLALGSENTRVSAAAAVALGVLRVREAGMALQAVVEEQSTHNRLLAQMALQEIAGPAQDDRLPWTRHFRPRR
jgi:hypothetical protein